MNAPRLSYGDVIGICSPSHIVTEESYASVFKAIENKGFRWKAGNNLFASGWGYSASAQERAADINQLIADPEVKLIFFGGGEGADDVLPLLDYRAAREHPKIWLSYSDGTSILNTVWNKTGLLTAYGQSVGMLPDMNNYDWANFEAHIIGCGNTFIHSDAPWITVVPGAAEGTLLGGYLDNFLHLLGCGWVKPEKNRHYLLFLEDNERFFGIEHESVLLTRLEQSSIIHQVTGILFGHYSAPVNEHLLERLYRLGDRWKIPVVYCDDFGHGIHHAILPIGARAHLDTKGHALAYLYE